MKLWLLSQSVNNDYDTYDAAVVAAETEEEARNTLPSEYSHWGEQGRNWAPTPDQVEVEYLGEAKEGTKAGAILSSFNAG